MHLILYTIYYCNTRNNKIDLAHLVGISPCDLTKVRVLCPRADQKLFILLMSNIVICDIIDVAREFSNIDFLLSFFCFQNYCPNSEMYGNSIEPLGPSFPKIPIDVLLDATSKPEPFQWDKKTDMSVDGSFSAFISKMKNWMVCIFKSQE